MAATAVHHGLTFTEPTGNPIHTSANGGTDKDLLIAEKTYCYSNTSTLTGLWLEDGAGYRNNNYDHNVTITHLGIGNNIVFGGTGVGQISFNNNHHFVMNTATDAGAWLDINASYTASNIDYTGMKNGVFYLNTYGALTGTTVAIANTNTVYATALFSDSYTGCYTLDGTTVTRTLLSGDFSSWSSLDDLKSHVVLSGVTDYTVSATATGLSVSYDTSSKAIPEPATASLSLLALAGLAARRRRK